MAARSILYVEDDDASFLLVEIALQEADPCMRLCRASDGEQALAFVQNSPPYQNVPRPDLILLDMNLPKKDGLEVLRVLKSDDSLRSIPVIMFTTSASGRDRETSMALGADEYVTKPRTLDLLVEALKSFANRSARSPADAGPPLAC